jgi:DNA-binding LacI/PurR family transcriptional regulator
VPKRANNTQSRVTIEDVAAHAGVSKSLVSLVMRDSPSVSDARRQRVMASAEQLGYRPNFMARSLAEQRTRTVGVVISDLHNPFFADVLDGMQDAADGLGLQVLLASGRRDPGIEERAVESFLQLRVEGAAFLAPLADASVLSNVARTVPCAVVGKPRQKASHVDFITNDDAVGAALAVGHLAELGHRAIAHISGGAGAGARERCLGYEQAMREHRLARFTQVVSGDYTDEAGYEAAKQLMAGRRPPTAIFAPNDLAAVGAMTALNELGMDVPKDVSVVGYDNTYLAGVQGISLTSVAQPAAEMGRLAIEAIVRRLDGSARRARTMTVIPELVARSSSGPALRSLG